MEKSEPALVPEWLRSSGSVTGGSNSSHHFSSSALNPDLSSSTRTRSFRNLSDKDSPRSDFLDRSSSSNSRRSSSGNSSVKHPYSSFTRSHRDRNRDKEKDRLLGAELWDNDSSDPLSGILTSRGEKNTLRRSQSVISRKPAEALPCRTDDSRNGVSSVGSNLIGIQKSVFEKDFPSLGTEGKQGASSIGRVPSPGLSTAVQSLPIGSSALVGGEKWTSALAEVPAIIGTNGQSSVQHGSLASPVSAASSSMAGLNMAEALSQAPPRARAAPQVLDKTQRLEELAIKQSRQLIPMVPNSSDKSKQLKTAIRTSEVIVAPKSVQQQPYSSQLAHQPRSGQVRSDASNTSHGGKFLVLKPARENGVPPARDVTSPTNSSSSQVPDGQVPVAPSTPPAALMSPSNPKIPALENRTATLTLNSKPNAEKKSSLSQAQSRSDFFNLMRKKSLNNTSNVLPDSGSAVSSSKLEKSNEVMKEVGSCPLNHVSENGSQVTSNVGSLETRSFPDDERDKDLYLNGAFHPDEEEAAFLRSLGWEENAGEDEGLTEEEINAFYQEYMKLLPSLKVCRGNHPKCSLLSDLRTTNSGGALSKSSSSGSEYGA